MGRNEGETRHGEEEEERATDSRRTPSQPCPAPGSSPRGVGTSSPESDNQQVNPDSRMLVLSLLASRPCV